MAITTWGTSARSSGEIRKGDSFFSLTFHVGHLVVWYMLLAMGLAYFFFDHFKNPLFLLIGVTGLILSVLLYIDVGKLGRKLAFWRKAPKTVESELTTNPSNSTESTAMDSHSSTHCRELKTPSYDTLTSLSNGSTSTPTLEPQDIPSDASSRRSVTPDHVREPTENN